MSKIIQVVQRQWVDQSDHSKGRIPFLNPSTLSALSNVLMIPTGYHNVATRGEVKFTASIYANATVRKMYPLASVLSYSLTAKKGVSNVVLKFNEGTSSPISQLGDIRDNISQIITKYGDENWLYDIEFSQSGLTNLLNTVESSTKVNTQTGEMLNPVPMLSNEWSDELWYMNLETGELSQTYTQWVTPVV